MILPNTDKVIRILEQYEYDTNDWLRKTFDISLYIACGYAKASANVLRNERPVRMKNYTRLYRKSYLNANRIDMKLR